MKRMMIAALAATSAIAAMPAAAATYVLDFDPAVACGAVPCTDGTFLSDAYGDQAGVDVSYRAVAGPGATTETGDMNYWSVEYGDLVDVAYATGGATAEIVFTALAGQAVTLNSLDYAGWRNTDRQSSLRVYDLAYNVLFDSGTITFPGQGHGTQAFNLTSTTGLRLQFGPDAFNGGVDNVSYSVNAAGQPGAVPEPATWAMMLFGFGAMGATLRRRRPALRVRYA